MSRGQHAADDGSFHRSAGGAMARGVALILVAIVLGVVLLRSTDASDPFTAGADDGAGRPTTVATDEDDDATTTTLAAQARDPAEVTILVANGSGVQGAAGRIAETLNGQNFVLKPSVNARAPAEASVVYFTPGYEPDAKAIAQLLTPQPAVQPMPDPLPVGDLAGANVLVVVAADLAAGR